MRKAKIMLAAIVLVAIIGSVLAFKASRFITQYCYTTTNEINVAHTSCPFGLLHAKTTLRVNPGTFYYYTTTSDPTNCNVVGGAAASCLPVNTPSARFTFE